MRYSRSLVLGLAVGLSLSFVASCGPAPQPCGPSTCTGCCDENGECLAGSSLLACGVGGGACAACEANQACLAGACGLIDGGDYDGSFPDRPDSSVNYDAGVYDGGPDAAVPDAGQPDAGRPDAGATDAGPPDSGMPVSFMNDIQPIFDARCGSCHSWGYANTVNAATSCGGAGSVRISPNSLVNSRLYGKVAGAPACGNSMPPGGPPLTQAQLDLLSDWILQGAPNN